MINLFKALKITCFITTFVGILVLALLMGAFNIFSFILFLAAALVWGLACIILFDIIATKRCNKYLNLLEACEPRQYADALEKLLPKAKDDITKNLLNLNLSAAYSDIGRDDYMAHYIFSVKLTEKTNIIQKAYYYNNLAAHYINIKESELALNTLNELDKLLGLPNINKKAKETLEKLLTVQKAELAILNGCFDGTEEIFVQRLNDAKTLREKVDTKSTLGVVYEHYGRIDEARECYRFASENGKEIRAAVLARVRLAELDRA